MNRASAKTSRIRPAESPPPGFGFWNSELGPPERIHNGAHPTPHLSATALGRNVLSPEGVAEERGFGG